MGFGSGMDGFAALNMSGDNAALLSGGQMNQSALSLNSTSNGRRLARVSCPAYNYDGTVRYYDSTGGNANYWGCGCHCPGGCYTNDFCHCACQGRAMTAPSPPPAGSLTTSFCPAGYYDSTGGNRKYWACGCHCPGGCYTNGVCQCACQPVSPGLVSPGAVGCKIAQPAKACNSAYKIDSGGFPFALGGKDGGKDDTKSKDDAIFPCSAWVASPVPCKGGIQCSTPDIPICCAGFVTGSVYGGGEWDCSEDMSSCSPAGKIFITGTVKVGIPECKWCWSLMEFSVEFARHWGKFECCAGPFAYTKDTISLKGKFFAEIVRSERGRRQRSVGVSAQTTQMS